MMMVAVPFVPESPRKDLFSPETVKHI